jgi:hypothetical protein
VTVIDANDVLLDNWPVVEVSGHVVSRGADELDSALLGPSVGRCANECRQEGVMDVDHRATEFAEEFRGEDLHVARQHH